jgi:ankyrin repeat protein
VFCQLVALKKCRKRDVLLEALKNLPETLDDTYARILTEIDERDRQDARRALLWLAFSNRPLRIEEVAEAAVVDPELDPAFNPETRLLDPRNDILEILGSLVTVSSKGATIRSDVDLNHNTCISDDDLDDDSDYLPGEKIGLAHFSVKDYLVSKRIQCSKANIFSVTDIAANAFIAKSCLLYILHYDESDSKTTSSDDLEYFPLLQYACKFWYVHAKSIQVGNRKSIDSITFRLFLSDTALMAWLQVHRPGDLNRKPFSFSEDAYSPLYYASDIGHEAVVRALLEHKADVDVKGRYGETALHWAAAGGHEAVVRALLEHKADVDANDKGGGTALYWAAAGGNEAVVRALLEHKADVDVKSKGGGTALHRAAARGHEAVVRALMEHKADVDAKDKGGETALHRAAAAGHVAVVRALLEHKADVDVKLKSGGTALHRAASNGREAVVRVLMEHKADVNAKDKGGETALHRAAARGHEAVMRALLEHEADVDAKERVERRRCNGRPLAGTRRWCGC